MKSNQRCPHRRSDRDAFLLNMGALPQDLVRNGDDHYQVILNEQGNRAFVTDPTQLPDAIREHLPFPVMSTLVLAEAQALAAQITRTLKFELWHDGNSCRFRPIFEPVGRQVFEYDRYKRRGTYGVSPQYVVPQLATYVDTFPTYQAARDYADSQGWEYQDL